MTACTAAPGLVPLPLDYDTREARVLYDYRAADSSELTIVTDEVCVACPSLIGARPLAVTMQYRLCSVSSSATWLAMGHDKEPPVICVF